MKTLKSAISNFLLIIIASCMVIPFIYMLLISFNVTYNEYNISFTSLTLENYKTILQDSTFLRYFINSSFIAVSGVILNVTFSSLAAYSFAKLDFKGNESIFFFMIMTLIIPSQVTMIPLYIIMKNLGLLNTYWALILPLPTAFGVFLMRQSILNIPRELIESARIDGLSEFKIFLYIVLPLIKPSIVALSIFTFIGAWNEFLWPLVATSGDDMKTLTVGMSTLGVQHHTNYGLVMAGATLTFLPAFIFYVLLQKKFQQGVTLSGMK
ncbi:carbohydrate ABC transporter permease [Clostridium cylindrosporum]|uniref:L-arabinose transport system permease protein AraQ n=1 Tax=Clostridium cylindrosporum DSM 605 TaxID=1121307 RepID=A0A0J8D7T0_CLOCY|nr:carbohydrate ABC transporter permease [Clostridium cylindrosporum]KMT22095.1 L-arabinose transport system permease protein AraQ [Clostridium cylindrosporum DSM 605]